MAMPTAAPMATPSDADGDATGEATGDDGDADGEADDEAEGDADGDAGYPLGHGCSLLAAKCSAIRLAPEGTSKARINGSWKNRRQPANVLEQDMMQ